MDCAGNPPRPSLNRWQQTRPEKQVTSHVWEPPGEFYLPGDIRMECTQRVKTETMHRKTVRQMLKYLQADTGSQGSKFDMLPLT